MSLKNHRIKLRGPFIIFMNEKTISFVNQWTCLIRCILSHLILIGFSLVTINNPNNFQLYWPISSYCRSLWYRNYIGFNKIDTFWGHTWWTNCMQHVYQEIGYQCLRVSSTEMKGIDKLKELMIGKAVCSLDTRSWKSTLVKCHGVCI
jgi:hypothetical protein